jgi:proteic killer suppression protein
MILSYRDKRTQVFANGEFFREFQGFERQCWKRLEILDTATSLAELGQLPSNRLEALKADRAGQYSIRINCSGGFVSSGPRAQPDPPTSRSWHYH